MTENTRFQSTHSLRSATVGVLVHGKRKKCFNPRTPCGVRLGGGQAFFVQFCRFQSTHSLRSATRGHCDICETYKFQSTHSLRSATPEVILSTTWRRVSIHALLAECDNGILSMIFFYCKFQSTHSLRSATAPNLIHCYSTKQIILCANLPKKTVIARLLFLSIYLSIFYSQCITPIADLPGNSCELEVGAQAMFNSL